MRNIGFYQFITFIAVCTTSFARNDHGGVHDLEIPADSLWGLVLACCGLVRNEKTHPGPNDYKYYTEKQCAWDRRTDCARHCPPYHPNQLSKQNDYDNPTPSNCCELLSWWFGSDTRQTEYDQTQFRQADSHHGGFLSNGRIDNPVVNNTSARYLPSHQPSSRAGVKMPATPEEVDEDMWKFILGSCFGYKPLIYDGGPDSKTQLPTGCGACKTQARNYYQGGACQTQVPGGWENTQVEGYGPWITRLANEGSWVYTLAPGAQCPNVRKDQFTTQARNYYQGGAYNTRVPEDWWGTNYPPLVPS